MRRGNPSRMFCKDRMGLAVLLEVRNVICLQGILGVQRFDFSSWHLTCWLDVKDCRKLGSSRPQTCSSRLSLSSRAT